MRLKPKLAPGLGEREVHGAEGEDPDRHDHPQCGDGVEVLVKQMTIEHTKESLKGNEDHDVERDTDVAKQEEWEILTEMIVQTHELTSSMEEPVS